MNLKSITTKLGLAVGACSLITIVSLVAFTTIKARDRAMESAKQHALAVAKDKAGQLQVEIETALDTSRTLADAFSAVKNPDSPLDMGRDPANAILQTVLTRNESFLAIYTLWEPEVFDQMDAAYAGLKGHDQTGRFIPYWTKSPDGTAVLKPLVGYETEGIGDYYLIPKKTKSEAVIDPHPSLFHKKDMDIISLVAPIVYNDEFFGIVGVDMSLDQLQKIVKKQQLYNGEAQISIISHNGAIAAASHHKAIVGKHMNAIHPDDLHDDYAIVKSGKEWVDIEGNTLLEVYTPLIIGNTKTPWSVNVMIPLELITAEATAGMWEDLSIGGGIALFAVLIIILFVSRFMRPLGHLTKSAEQVALGDLNYKDIETSNDEIGKVNKSFKHVVDSLKEITSVCEAVSVGDFSRSVNVRSEHDMLGKSINQMAENLRGVVNQAGEIAKGNYSIQVAPKSEQDELGNALFEMTRSLIDVTADNENQNWFKTGQTKLHERMRREQDIGGLCRNIITFLSKYLGAQIGAIYIAGDDNYLRLAGSYAFTARKNVSNEFEIGRGLVGQAAFEKKSILLTNVPEDYVAVSSGLGEAAPRNIMVVPFLRDDEVMGVVELGSFDEFSDSHLKFLDLVS
ncbi:MAG: GAF domain-containing protein, partial [Pseudomonadota bacterium]